MEKQLLIPLVYRAQAGDSDAISTLFQEYKDVVYSIAMRETKDRALSDDIVQEAFIEVIQKIGNLQTPEAFPAWLKAVAYHQCTRYYKKKETVHESLASENEEGFSIFDTQEEKNASFIPDEALDQKEFKATILEMVDNLPDVQRSALYMFYFEELPLKVIAKVQGVSLNTANTRLNRGRLAMKTAITHYEKKHGIRLHSIAFFPFLKWLLQSSQRTMPVSSSAAVAQNIAAETGITITTVEAAATAAGTAVAGSSATTAGTGAAAGIGAKIAAIPFVTKLTAGIVAVSMAVGIPLAINRLNPQEINSTEPNETIIAETESNSIEPQSPTIPAATIPVVTEPAATESPIVDELLGYHAVIDQYTEAMAHNFYYDPETGMPVDVEESKTHYLSSELAAGSRYYSNFGGNLYSEDLLVYYALIDMNSDGINELLVGAGSASEEIRIYGFFTLHNNAPVRVVDDYSLGYRVILTIFEDLSFQKYGSGGYAYNTYEHCVLEAGKTAPTLLYSYEQDGEDTFYYAESTGEKTRISEQEFLKATDSSNYKLCDIPWVLISSQIQDDVSDTTDETEPQSSNSSSNNNSSAPSNNNGTSNNSSEDSNSKNDSSSDTDDTLKYVGPANPATGLSWDGVSPIIYTYPDGTTGTTPILGATYERKPGIYSTVTERDLGLESDEEYFGGASDFICDYCGRAEGDGANGTCVRWDLVEGDHPCPSCATSVPAHTCHSC